MEKIYYTTIKIIPLCKNGGWKFGGNATTKFSDNKEMKHGMDAEMFGESEEICMEKMLKFLSGNGTTEIECIE